MDVESQDIWLEEPCLGILRSTVHPERDSAPYRRLALLAFIKRAFIPVIIHIYIYNIKMAEVLSPSRNALGVREVEVGRGICKAFNPTAEHLLAPSTLAPDVQISWKTHKTT